MTDALLLPLTVWPLARMSGFTASCAVSRRRLLAMPRVHARGSTMRCVSRPHEVKQPHTPHAREHRMTEATVAGTLTPAFARDAVEAPPGVGDAVDVAVLEVLAPVEKVLVLEGVLEVLAPLERVAVDVPELDALAPVDSVPVGVGVLDAVQLRDGVDDADAFMLSVAVDVLLLDGDALLDADDVELGLMLTDAVGKGGCDAVERYTSAAPDGVNGVTAMTAVPSRGPATTYALPYAHDAFVMLTAGTTTDKVDAPLGVT